MNKVNATCKTSITFLLLHFYLLPSSEKKTTNDKNMIIYLHINCHRHLLGI